MLILILNYGHSVEFSSKFYLVDTSEGSFLNFPSSLPKRKEEWHKINNTFYKSKNI